MTQTFPSTMFGVQLMGHGGLDKLVYKHDIPTPQLGDDDVLVKVGAAGVNNTDINTRIGWYSKSVTSGTDTGASDGFNDLNEDDASWAGEPIPFPRIQGADVAGVIVAAGKNVDANRIGERVLLCAMQPDPDTPYQCATQGSETDGGFAEFTKVNSRNAFAINTSLSDAELASFPCAYSTAENLLDRANVQAGEVVLVTGASGGVGSAAVQLIKRRGAKVIAICGKEKEARLQALGVDTTVPRGQSLVSTLGEMSVDVVIDLVAGPQFPELLAVLKRGGRYAVSGAIGGPIVELDVRTLYLKDLSFFGGTYQAPHVFKNLVKYIENGELTPLVAKTYPLEDIQQAQTDFLAKGFVGKLVLIP
ncbi:alcohol dehydrogenase family protein [Enterovibrio norvegicus]|uniref:alcohol dehydrogenase family protein n=1 Tax=Enterovibrio norvegicus TaxID=188144 RepID=UPI0035524157